jgi:hypothetical protein
VAADSDRLFTETIASTKHRQFEEQHRLACPDQKAIFATVRQDIAFVLLI